MGAIPDAWKNTFATTDLHRAKRAEKVCAKCGVLLRDRRKTYCGPCYGIRYEENVTRNRAKYRAMKLERKSTWEPPRPRFAQDWGII